MKMSPAMLSNVQNTLGEEGLEMEPIIINNLNLYYY